MECFLALGGRFQYFPLLALSAVVGSLHRNGRHDMGELEDWSCDSRDSPPASRRGFPGSLKAVHSQSKSLVACLGMKPTTSGARLRYRLAESVVVVREKSPFDSGSFTLSFLRRAYKCSRGRNKEE